MCPLLSLCMLLLTFSFVKFLGFKMKGLLGPYYKKPSLSLYVIYLKSPLLAEANTK
jgi:hypothetical protein